MLIRLPGILSAPEIAQAQAMLKQAPWEDGKSSAGSQAAEVKNNEQLPHDSEAAKYIRTRILEGLDRSSTFFGGFAQTRFYAARQPLCKCHQLLRQPY